MSQVIKLKETFIGEEINLKISVNIGTQVKKEHLIEDELGNSKDVYIKFFDVIETWFGDIRQYHRRLRLIGSKTFFQTVTYQQNRQHEKCGFWLSDCLNNDQKISNIEKVCNLLGISCVAY